jgi:ribosomal protein L32E
VYSNLVLGGKPKGFQNIKGMVTNAEDLKKMKQVTRAARMAVVTSGEHTVTQ